MSKKKYLSKKEFCKGAPANDMFDGEDRFTETPPCFSEPEAEEFTGKDQAPPVIKCFSKPENDDFIGENLVPDYKAPLAEPESDTFEGDDCFTDLNTHLPTLKEGNHSEDTPSQAVEPQEPINAPAINADRKSDAASIAMAMIMDKPNSQKIDICAVAKHLIDNHIVKALHEQSWLAIFDEEQGFFQTYDNKKFELYLRRIFTGTEIDRLLCPNNSHAIFDRLLMTPEIQDVLDSFDCDQPFLNVENGMVDVSTGQFLDYHSPERKFLSVLRGKYIVGSYPEPITFNAFVERNFPTPADALLFRQVMFYILSWIRTAKLAFYIKGQTNTGKSQIAGLLRLFLGDGNSSMLTLPQICNRWGVSGLVGSRLNICTEVERDYLTRGSEIKSIISLDPQTAEFKGKDYFTCTLRVCLLLLGNGLLKVDPRIADTALLERFLFLETLNPVERSEWNIHLLDDLWSERDSILTQIINVGIEWFQTGMLFVQAETSARLARLFKCPPRSLAAYVEECGEFGPKCRVWTCDILKGFEAWQVQNGFSGKIELKVFYAALDVIAQEHKLVGKKLRIKGREGSRHGYIGLSIQTSFS